VAKLSDDQIASILFAHGITGGSLITGITIVLAESGGDTSITHRNVNGSTDRGMWQWNNHAHPEVPDACAFSPDCATAQVRRYVPGYVPWAGDILRRVQFLNRARIAAAKVTKGGGAQSSQACAKLTKPQFDAELKAIQDAVTRNPNISFPALAAAGSAACVKVGGNPINCAACSQQIINSLGGAAQDVAKGLGATPCIHQVGLGPFNFCADVVLGGLKVAAGGAIVGIAGLAMLYLLGRDLGATAGAGTAVEAAKKVTPGPVKVPLKLASKATPRTYRRSTPVPKAEQARRQKVYQAKVAARTPAPAPEPKTERLPDRIDTRKMTTAQRRALGERLRAEAR
jgi:hypothetical protein